MFRRKFAPADIRQVAAGAPAERGGAARDPAVAWRPLEQGGQDLRVPAVADRVRGRAAFPSRRQGPPSGEDARNEPLRHFATR